MHYQLRREHTWDTYKPSERFLKLKSTIRRIYGSALFSALIVGLMAASMLVIGYMRYQG